MTSPVVHRCPVCLTQIPKHMSSMWFGENGLFHFQDKAIVPTDLETRLLAFLMNQDVGVSREAIEDHLETSMQIPSIIFRIRTKFREADIPEQLILSDGRPAMYQINPRYR